MSENDNLEEIWNMIQKEYPLVMFTGSSRLYTMVRRMQAEKKYNIPFELRSGFAISVKTGKHANEMAEQEWEEFYNALRMELKEKFPMLYTKLFRDDEDLSK
ncbi:MAG: hypothetical protein IH585_09835 [Anaerolineaceae bacterium]|nr:hypothetical protein [Anaerolineaceae bacterium]